MALRITNGDIEHVIEVTVEPIERGIQVVGRYLRGSLELDPGAVVARWPVRYEAPEDHFSGQVAIGDGRIEIPIPQLRRLGLGSLFMGILIGWIKAQPRVPVAPIDLKGDDARTVEDRDSRNRFYEKFGFVFDYEDDRTWGTSRPMSSAGLLQPKTQFPDDWTVTETSS